MISGRVCCQGARAHHENDGVTSGQDEGRRRCGCTPHCTGTVSALTSLRRPTPLQTAIALHPSDAKLYSYLGDTLNNMKQFRAAVEAYEKGIKLDKCALCGAGTPPGHALAARCSPARCRLEPCRRNPELRQALVRTGASESPIANFPSVATATTTHTPPTRAHVQRVPRCRVTSCQTLGRCWRRPSSTSASAARSRVP